MTLSAQSTGKLFIGDISKLLATGGSQNAAASKEGPVTLTV